MKAKDKVFVYYDAEGDFLEVTLDETREGDMAQTADERVAVKLDDDGNIIGFHILAVSSLKSTRAKPFEVELTSSRPPRNIPTRQR